MSEFVWTLANSGIWGTAGNWFDATSGQSATIAPGAGDQASVDGPGGNQFQIVAGPAAAAVAYFYGNNALEPGAVANGASFAFGNIVINPLTLGAYGEAVDVEAGVVLTAADLTASSNLELDGAVAGVGQIFQGLTAASDMLVLNTAALAGNDWDINGGNVYIDPTSRVVIGGGGGNPGVLNIGVNGALNFSNGGGEVDNAVVDDGMILSSYTSLVAPRIDGVVSGDGQIDVSTRSGLGFYSGVYGVSLIQGGVQSSMMFEGGASGIGGVTLGSLASAQFEGTLQGTGTISVGYDAYLRTSGIANGLSLTGGAVSGFAQMQLATGATFSTAGGDAGVPISLAGSNELVLDHHDFGEPGVDLTGAVANFDPTDVIRDESAGFLYGITGVITAANIVSGTLVLSDDGVTVETVTMPGDFSSQQFVVNSAGESGYNFTNFGAVYSNVVLAAGPASVSDNSGAGEVTGAAGSQFDTLNGGGSYTSLYLTGNTAINGGFGAGAVTFNVGFGNAPDYFVIQAGGSIGAGVSTVVSNLEVVGAQAAFNTAGTFTLGGGAGGGEPNLFVLNGATVQAGAMNILGIVSGSQIFLGPSVVIDPTASVEVGTAGGAALGAITVDDGHTLTNHAFLSKIYGDVVDNGVIVNGAPVPALFTSSMLSVYGTLRGNGALEIDNGTYFKANAINGLSAISVGSDSQLDVYGDMTSGVSLTTGSLSNFVVTGSLSGLDGLTTGAHSGTEVFGNVAVTNAVTVGTLASAAFEADLSGAGLLLVQTGGEADVGGVLSGFSGVTLAYGAALKLFGTDTAVPIDLAAGGNLLEVGASAAVSAPVTGFNVADLLTIVDSPLPEGGRPITSVQYTPGGGTGTLTLSYDGVEVNSFNLAGDDEGQIFLTNSVGIDDGNSDITLADGSTSIAASGDVTGGPGALFMLLAGGSGGNLNVYNNVAVTGAVNADNVTFNAVTLNSSFEPISIAATDIEAAASVIATGTAAIYGNVEVNGAGATLAAAEGIIGDGNHASRLLVVNQGLVEFSNTLRLNGLGGAGTGYQIELDPTAALEVGNAGGEAAGSVTVDAGSTVVADGTNATINAPVVDDGLVETAYAPQKGAFAELEIVGRVSGDGLIAVGSLTSIFVNGSISGIGGISVASAGSFEAGVATGLGPITAADNAGVTFEGNATWLAGISVGAQGRLIIAGNASGTGAVTLGEGATGGLYGTLSGFSGVTVGADAALQLLGVDAGVELTLLGDAQNGGSDLTIAEQTPVDAVISGFTFGDAIDVLDGLGVYITEADYTPLGGGLGELVLSDDGVVENVLTLAGNFAGDTFLTNAAGQFDETVVTLAEDAAACYCPGTRIRTPEGEVAVETLREGDWVMTLHRGARRVRWIGQRSYDGRFIAGQVLMLPICIAQGALGDGVPARDLWVSPGHGIFVGGVIVPAWRLVNGRTIWQAAEVERVCYIHVELDSHEVIFAEGCAAESYFDNGGRRQFETWALAPMTPEGGMCAARVEDGFVLQALARRGVGMGSAMVGFVDEAGPRRVSGWAWDAAAPEMAVCLDVLAGGRRVRRVLANTYRADVRKAGFGNGCCGFEVMLPEGVAGKVEVRAARGAVPLIRAA